jgi:hypothetical protein
MIHGRSSTDRHLDKPASFDGFWLCQSLQRSYISRLFIDYRAMIFASDRRGRMYLLSFTCEHGDPDKEGPVGYTYVFVYHCALRKTKLKLRFAGVPRHRVFDVPWRRTERGCVEMKFGRSWELYEPATLAKLRRNYFDMKYIRKYLTEAKQLGWRFSLKPRLPRLS